MHMHGDVSCVHIKSIQIFYLKLTIYHQKQNTILFSTREREGREYCTCKMSVESYVLGCILVDGGLKLAEDSNILSSILNRNFSCIIQYTVLVGAIDYLGFIHESDRPVRPVI
jgi:hypothetical protein